jgi:hypothetical protein
LKSHDSLRNQYIQKAKRSGLNPEDVVIDYRNVEPKTEIPTETKSAHGSGKTLTEEQINLYKKYNIPLPQR